MDKVYTSLQGQYILSTAQIIPQIDLGSIFLQLKFIFSYGEANWILLSKCLHRESVVLAGHIEVFDGKIPFIYITELYTCESWMH